MLLAYISLAGKETSGSYYIEHVAEQLERRCIIAQLGFIGTVLAVLPKLHFNEGNF